ncbi:MAG: DUF1553 domain-containing protein [Planctomycetota bacterium]|jgi:hypothetical protein
MSTVIPALAATLSISGLDSIAFAQHEDIVRRSAFFESEAWPIIERECLPCHGSDGRPKGGLRLDHRPGMVEGGDRGPAFDEASPESSLLLRMISWEHEDYRMPPKGRLSDHDIAILNEWVLEGATWADGVGADPSDAEADTDIPVGGDWWAWQPLVRPDVPDVDGAAWVRNPVDAFVLARLEDADLAPAPEADRHTLVRRVALDLTGLPPTPAEIAAFIGDEAPGAYERMVDRFLESPQHGVKWARHWLDAVRYADTDGYERDRIKPEAWRYRDWVVGAINEDLPWNRFLVEQLAGDELPDRDLSTLTATGFYRLGIWDDEPTDVELAKNDDLDSIIDVVGRGMMGMSVACARCHEHKRDPILQGDYYRLAAIFRDLAPYKERMGNAIDANNVTRQVPEHFGAEGEAEFAEAHDRYEARFASTLQRLQVHAETVVLSSDADPRDAGLVAHYPMDDSEQGELRDSTGNHPGRLIDARLGREGRVGNALGFDGGDDRATIPNSANKSFTVSFWLRTTAQARGSASDPRWFLGSGLIDGEVPGIVNDFGIAMVGPGVISAGVGRPETFIHSAPGFNDGDWHHVALTRDASTGRFVLYVDGIEVDAAVGGRQPLNAIDELTVGRAHPGGGGFAGTLDEIRIHDRPLPRDEIAGLALDLRLDEAMVDSIRTTNGAEAAREFAGLRDELLELEPPQTNPTLVLCARSRGPVPPRTNILIRGDAHSPGRLVSPGVPKVLGGVDFAPAPPEHRESSGLRLAFAEWLVEEDNRVTWRVAANRLWQHVFGRGLVRSSDDFGFLGTRPTHPQLLDWLATEFANRDLSRRQMARLILTSSTYRQSSRFDPAAFEQDPLNDLFWRFDLRRLAAEEIRDSILAVSGNLNPRLGGKGVYPPLPRAVLETASRPDAAWGSATPEQAGRRSLYVFLKRSLRHPLLEGFDQPDTDRPCSIRFATTVPTQSLMMMNSDFIDRQADLFASRLVAENPAGLEARVRHGLELVLCRPPEPTEITEMLELHAELLEIEGLSDGQAFKALCVLMLNLNEFLHVG